MSKDNSEPTAKDLKFVKELMSLLEDSNLMEIDFQKGDLGISLSKSGPAAAPMQHVMAAAPAAAPAPAVPSQPVATKESPADAAAHPGAVKSPMVGTAYTRPSPDADVFVKVGDKVKEGDTVMLIEAMKTFNPIVAPKSGKIEDMLVEDASAVEFGEALFIIV
ncbi:acetyl-CoA carboxylase biotin carboxyl carrier protein [Litorimonas sp. WD9-15]|uniref:acetyl-CoA carboxylase biotin carboxyl carrier protein n=1 Tax=Litorimonas sp. WD9-15 TaxID=3418716 RepID=UPI003D060E9B